MLKTTMSNNRYPLTELYIFKMYDRASYRQAFGEDPPTYDPSKPTKSWLDPSAGAAPVQYQFWGWDADRQYTHQKFTLSASDAATLNVWGVRPYPPYVPIPTRATRGGTGGGMFPMQPTILSTKTEADALAAAWKLPLSSVMNGAIGGGPFPDTFPADEPRRPWAIFYSGVQFYVGEQIAIQNGSGVGAPGHWDLSGFVPEWVSDIPPLPMTQNPEGPIPMRALKSNERFVTGGIMDPGPYIERSDLPPPDTTDQRLQRIEDRVNAIAQRLGIS